VYRGHSDAWNWSAEGSLGDVLKESAQLAISYCRSNARFAHVKFQSIDIHVNLQGSYPKVCFCR